MQARVAWTSYMLFAAAKAGDVARALSALRSGADIEAREWGETPLMMAAQNGHTELVEALLARGAAVDAAEPESGLHALDMAVFRRHVSTARALLARGAEAGAHRGELKHTALHCAANAELGDGPLVDGELVELLLSYGADVNALGGEQYTPLHCAGYVQLNGTTNKSPSAAPAARAHACRRGTAA
jgi:ankyrin repeat protein